MQMTAPRAMCIVGLLLVVGGLGVALTRPAAFGWFAYAPDRTGWDGATAGVSAIIPSGELIALGPAQLGGYGAALLGLLTLAAVSGYVLGRRASAPESRPSAS